MIIWALPHASVYDLLLSSTSDLLLQLVNILNKLLPAALQHICVIISTCQIQAVHVSLKWCYLGICPTLLQQMLSVRGLSDTLKSKYRYTNQDVYPRPTSSSSFGTCKHTLALLISRMPACVLGTSDLKSVLKFLTNGTEFTADTMVEENHSRTTAPTP